MKLDTHVHTFHSGYSTIYPLSGFVRECYNTPEGVYRAARSRGMDLVVITDHDEVSGAVSLGDRPDVIIGSEVTGVFADDGVKVHLNVFDLDESQHREVQRLRHDIRQLMPYLRHQRLFTSLNHVASGINGPITAPHVAALLPWVQALEVNNGSRLPVTNRTAECIAEAAGKMGLGGSDSHTHRGIGRTWTEVPYKSDPDLIAAHASAPFVVSWDDHEVDNDYADATDENDSPPEVFLLRRAAAYQAYFEHMPLRAASLPLGPRLQLYRRLVFGNLIDLSVLDTRQYRSDQACGHGAATNCAAAADPARSILGATQEKWLFEQLAAARSRWTVLGQQVPMFARDNGADAPATTRLSMDKWDGYTAGRQRLFAHLRETKAANPIVLSGDVHVHYGADLELDFANPASETVGVEFTNSSITSGGDGAEVAANWERLRANNPHIKFHSNRRGYIACTATKANLRAEFKVVDRVTTANEPVRVAGAMVVEAGRAGGRAD